MNNNALLQIEGYIWICTIKSHW